MAMGTENEGQALRYPHKKSEFIIKNNNLRPLHKKHRTFGLEDAELFVGDTSETGCFLLIKTRIKPACAHFYKKFINNAN